MGNKKYCNCIGDNCIIYFNFKETGKNTLEFIRDFCMSLLATMQISSNALCLRSSFRTILTVRCEREMLMNAFAFVAKYLHSPP